MKLLIHSLHLSFTLSSLRISALIFFFFPKNYFIFPVSARLLKADSPEPQRCEGALSCQAAFIAGLIRKATQSCQKTWQCWLLVKPVVWRAVSLWCVWDQHCRRLLQLHAQGCPAGPASVSQHRVCDLGEQQHDFQGHSRA